MITLAGCVLVFVALGIAAHFFGVDSRDADYSARVTPHPMPQAAPCACAAQPAKRIG